MAVAVDSTRSAGARQAAVRRRRALALAGLALGAAALAFVLLRGGHERYRVTAVFDQVNGLVVGADVKAAGVNVGKVDEIKLGADGLPHVTLAIDDDYRLERGAFANLRAGSAAGQTNRFIELSQGKGPELPSGATLGLAASDQPVEPDRILSSLNPRTRAEVRATLAGLDRSTKSRGAALAETMRHSAAALGNTADAVAQVDQDRQALKDLVASGRQVVETVADHRDALGATADSLATTLGATAKRERELSESVGLLPSALDAPRGALDRLDRSIPTLRELVSRARPGVRELVPVSRALRPALQQARPVLRDAAGLIGEAPDELRALTPVLDRAKPAAKVANPALRSAGPILDEVRVRTPDFFSFFSNWADFTSLYDANGHGARVGIVLAPAPNNLIDGSNSGAGTLKAPFVRTPGVLEGAPWTNYRDSFIGSDFSFREGGQ